MTHPLDPQVEPFLLMLRQEKRLAETTIELYRIEIRELLRLLTDPTQVHGLKVYLGLKSPDTHSRKLLTWRRFLSKCGPPWKDCLSAFEYPKKKEKLPKFFTEEEKASLLLACRTSRERVLITLGLQLGLRRNELLELKFESIEPDHFLRIRRKGGKEQRLPLDDNIKGLLLAYMQETSAKPSHYILHSLGGKKLSSSGLAFLFKEIAKRAGVKGTLHAMRHTFATSLSNKGADLFALKELMGHSSLQTTQRYLHATPNHLRKTLDLIR